MPYFPYEQPPLYPGGNEQFTKEMMQRVRRLMSSVHSPQFLRPGYLMVSFLLSEDGRLTQLRIEVPSLLRPSTRRCCGPGGN